MFNQKILQIYFLVFIVLSQIASAKTTEPLLLADLGRQKEISNILHIEPNLSEQLKEDHNLLAGEMNGFIEAIVIITISGAVPKEEKEKNTEALERRKIKINKMAESLYKHLHDKNYKGRQEIGLNQQMASLSSKSILGANSSVSLINVEIGPDSVKEFLNFFQSNESKAKDYYIKKLEEKKWTKIL